MALFDAAKRVLDTAHAVQGRLEMLADAARAIQRKTEEIERVLREHEGRLSRLEGFVAGAGSRLPSLPSPGDN